MNRCSEQDVRRCPPRCRRCPGPHWLSPCGRRDEPSLSVFAAGCCPCVRPEAAAPTPATRDIFGHLGTALRVRGVYVSAVVDLAGGIGGRARRPAAVLPIAWRVPGIGSGERDGIGWRQDEHGSRAVEACERLTPEMFSRVRERSSSADARSTPRSPRASLCGSSVPGSALGRARCLPRTDARFGSHASPDACPPDPLLDARPGGHTGHGRESRFFSSAPRTRSAPE